jgi:hypothetical protein
MDREHAYGHDHPRPKYIFVVGIRWFLADSLNVGVYNIEGRTSLRFGECDATAGEGNSLSR